MSILQNKRIAAAVIRIVCPVIAFAALTGCSISAISPDLVESGVPESWQASAVAGPVNEQWLAEFQDQRLEALVAEAQTNNYRIAEQLERVEEALQGVVVVRADRFPELSAGFDANRRQPVIADSMRSLGTDFSLGADASWEVDVWGKLRDAERQAHLSLSAAQAELTRAQYQLAADTGAAWYTAVAARQLLALFSQRLANLEQNLEIIERGYRHGVNAALDVYLTRDTVERERARVADQGQRMREAVIGLQLLMARYPDGELAIEIDLPVLDASIPAGLPSELLTRRPDIQQAWLQLLAADAALAVAHKQRFPRIGLVATTSDVSSELTELLNGSSLAWSLLGNIAQPVFNAGRLLAAEEQARSRVAQAEERYLDRLFLSFSEVENAISRQASLADRYRARLESEKSAVAAYSLSFEQYQRGLVTYTTVLEAQRRAFDAQTTVLDLRNQLLQNRIGLHLALGGGFATATPK